MASSPEQVSEKKSGSLPPMPDARSKKQAMVYTEREQQVLKQIFSLVFTSADLTEEFSKMIEGDNAEQYYQTTVNMSIATGLSFTVTKSFIVREFKENANNVNSIMRGNSTASKIMKSYLNTTGGPYLKQVFGSLITQLALQEHKTSYELDPSKCEFKGELLNNTEKLLDKMRIIVNQITDPKIVDAMPPEIRIIAGFIADISRDVVPQNNTWALVGGFLLLRYFNPAILSPDQYGLLPEGKSISTTVRRNLVLVSKILQNLSNGLEFGKKEQYMMVVNPFIAGNKERMEKYFQEIVSFVPHEKGTALYAPDPKAVRGEDFHIMHRFFTKNRSSIQELFTNKQDATTFTNLMEKIGSYSSKTSFSFLSGADKKAVTALLEVNGDEPLYVGWVDKRRRNKVQKRLFVVSHHRIMTLKPGGKLAREGHMLDLLALTSTKQEELEVKFKNFNIVCTTEDADPIIAVIRRCYAENFPAMPEALRAKFIIMPQTRKEALDTDIILTPAATLCGGYVSMYQTICNYYQTPPHPDVCWHFTHLPAHVRTFDLKRFTKNYSEVALDSLSLGSMFYALRYSVYFERLYVKGWRLDRDTFMDLVQTMKYNGAFIEIVLQGLGSSASSFAALFDGMAGNTDCRVSSIDISNNNIEDKGAASLANFLKTAKHQTRVLNLDNTSIGKHGFSAIFKDLWERGKREGSDLRIFSASDNKQLGSALDTLCPMLEKCGHNLTELRLSNTNINLSVLLPAVSRTCPVLEVIDLSQNRCKPQNCPEICQLLQNSRTLRSLNMSGCKVPQESIKDILTAPSNHLELDLDLSDNGLTITAAMDISTLPFKMTSITNLNLSDNDFGDEGIAAIAEGLCASSTMRSLSFNRCWNGKNKALAVESRKTHQHQPGLRIIESDRQQDTTS